jgi:hypothetical protein
VGIAQNLSGGLSKYYFFKVEPSMSDRTTLPFLMVWLNGVAKIPFTLIILKKHERCFEQILFLQSSRASL